MPLKPARLKRKSSQAASYSGLGGKIAAMFCVALAQIFATIGPVWAKETPAKTPAAGQRDLLVTPLGPQAVHFNPARDACDGHDVPDTPLRAFRDAGGQMQVFALHFENRRLTGKDVFALKPDCAVVFRGRGDADPARYDDRAWIAATYSPDGKRVIALAHHEYQGNQHPGRCRFDAYLPCWWNSVLALASSDGGARFAKTTRAVMAASREKFEIGQGRHRGFFNPSNLLAREGWLYTLIGTTGWQGQGAGTCLFRVSLAKAEGSNGEDWRAFDGAEFTARFPDPYQERGKPGPGCQTLAPFPGPVGSITLHRPSGRYVAVFSAAAGSPDGNGGLYARSGFYSATSRDLRHWGEPSLVLETRTLYDDACGVDFLRSYPVLLDPAAQSRNFEDVGEEARLFFVQMRVENCQHSGDRQLVSRKVRISSFERN